MRENDDGPLQFPLTFLPDDPTTVRSSQLAHTDVVESTSPARSGLHSEFETAACNELFIPGHLTASGAASGAHEKISWLERTEHDRVHFGHTDAHRGVDGERHNDDVDYRGDLHFDFDSDQHGDLSAQQESRPRDDDQRALRALRRVDDNERRAERIHWRAESVRKSGPQLTRGPRTTAWARSMVPRRHSSSDGSTHVRRTLNVGTRHRDRGGQSNLSTRDHGRNGSNDYVDPSTSPLTRFATGPLQGGALTLYFVLLPYVIATKWRLSYTVSNGAVLRDLLVGLALFWIVFLGLLFAYLHQLRHSRRLPSNGCAWLASIIIAALPFLIASSADAHTQSGPHPHSVTAAPRTPNGKSFGAESVGALPHSAKPERGNLALIALALSAKGRRDRLREGTSFSDPTQDDDPALEEFSRRLREGDDELVRRLRDVIGSGLDGELVVDEDAFTVQARHDFDPVVVSVIASRGEGLVIGFAREGGRLPVDLTRHEDDLVASIVALHDGCVRFARDENELVRTLARRRDTSVVVVFLGDASEVDQELLEYCVTLRRAGGTENVAVTPVRRVRVELLRAYPQVQGLSEDFVPTLRRRCLEMVAYLAMHPGEPVTGDRLRSRVLVHADVDASKTTLSNTASAVRRALGLDSRGHLLEPVSSGLYQVRGVEIDVVDFHRLVALARQSSAEDAMDLYVRALRIVHGEPLASVLKGFEWFIFEGHRAQLMRDGEWVALALHDAALDQGDSETAFWALRQGLLLDPDSDELLDALQRVPRLRQFRGDGTGTAQNESVGARRAVAMSWAFERFGR